MNSDMRKNTSLCQSKTKGSFVAKCLDSKLSMKAKTVTNTYKYMRISMNVTLGVGGSADLIVGIKAT